jgi:hypothetical protein
VLPPTAPGKVLLQDKIRSGSYGTFGGFAQFYNFIWIMLPGVLTFYICVLLALVGSKHLLKYHRLASTPTGSGTSSSGGFDAPAPASGSGSGSGSSSGLNLSSAATSEPSSTSSGMPHSKHGTCVNLLQAMRTGTVVLMVLGILLIILNLIAAIVEDNPFTNCSPLLHISAACISRHPTSLYQYFWVLLSTGVLTTASYMAYHVALRDGSARAKRVFEIIRVFVYSYDGQCNAIAIWKDNIWPQSAQVEVRVRWHRRVAYDVLHLPLLALASIPDFLYGNC